MIEFVDMIAPKIGGVVHVAIIATFGTNPMTVNIYAMVNEAIGDNINGIK